MKKAFRFLSIASALVVSLKGIHLLWQYFISNDLKGHYDPLGSFMDYLVHYGVVAFSGVVFGFLGKTRIGVIGNLSYVVFLIVLYVGN